MLVIVAGQLNLHFNPVARCNAAQSDLQHARDNESSERTQALAGKRASAGIAIRDAMDQTSDAVGNVRQSCK